MTRVAVLVLNLIPCFVLATDGSQYAVEELRSIKSLSVREIEGLRQGEGMGFAKLAELNHFPGPRHVLDISAELGLSSQQLSDTQSLFDEMHRSAVALGEQIIVAESRLNQEFEQGSVGPEFLEAAVLEIGNLRARLRFVHLRAHLRQKQLLTPEQIQQYDVVRGYHGGPSDHNEHQHGHD